ncbi:hypothetical protein [Geomesophilobacter sediminis]|uniref:Uncharacterized protein n=1 Tax=Geomesophilobacter sediminis TaxID=2798584 RepID=A0A8J7SBS1_9BACT|nr:hypothetical protein [Geomesophilobacter sediminis]MBJ6726524.1 hypothetical protein [Geomesophilobacter sediminis]
MRSLIYMVEEGKGGARTAQAVRDSIYAETKTMEDLEELMDDAESCHYDE